MEFPRQEYWSGQPFPSPRDLPDTGTEPASPALAGRYFRLVPPGKSKGNKCAEFKDSSLGGKGSEFGLLKCVVCFMSVASFW